MEDKERISNLENTIYNLNNEIEYLHQENDRLSAMIQDLYEMIRDESYQSKDSIRELQCHLYNHEHSFHAMLIIGNKEKKDESNIS
jgi:predicted RNase H-like nuclease (RuvC/YqgF family)